MLNEPSRSMRPFSRALKEVVVEGNNLGKMRVAIFDRDQDIGHARAEIDPDSPPLRLVSLRHH